MVAEVVAKRNFFSFCSFTCSFSLRWVFLFFSFVRNRRAGVSEFSFFEKAVTAKNSFWHSFVCVCLFLLLCVLSIQKVLAVGPADTPFNIVDLILTGCFLGRFFKISSSLCHHGAPRAPGLPAVLVLLVEVVQDVVENQVVAVLVFGLRRREKTLGLTFEIQTRANNSQCFLRAAACAS